jgi:cyclase
MLKKRLIFTLLYHQGSFMLSRNFRLQKVGSLNWLQRNYDFSHISYSIDELVMLNVERTGTGQEAFCDALKTLAKDCFVPISAGGGIRRVDDAKRLLRSGADKIVVNTPLFESPGLVDSLAAEFGQQCIVGAVDAKRRSGPGVGVWSNCGTVEVADELATCLGRILATPIGELYLNSMDRDGTGQGYDLPLLDALPSVMPIPVILAGGVGNAAHLAAGLADSRVDAVATANLFNFVGDGLKQARRSIIAGGVELPSWDIELMERHLGADRRSLQ